MLKKRFVIVGLVWMLLLLPACGEGGLFKSETPTPTLTFTPKATLTPTPVPPTATPEATPTEDNFVTVTFNNDTEDLVCAIFAFTTDHTGEAPNLIEGQLMTAGQTVSVDLEKGDYDFQVWDCQMGAVNNLYQFMIEEDFAWDLSGVPENYSYEAQQSVILINERAWDVCEFYIRPADSDDWGNNLFFSEYDYYLSAGSTLIEPIEPGVFDFKLVYCDGTVASVKEDLEVPEGQNMTWTLTP